MFRVVRSTAAAVLVVAALSGCSLIAAQNQAPPTTEPTDVAEAGQTAKQACDLLLPVMLDVGSRLNDVYATLQSGGGPEDASPVLHSVSDDLHDVLDEITNDEVHDVTSTAVDSLDRMTADIDDIIAGNGDPQALLNDSKAVNDDFSAIDPVCQAAG